jgi:hypothetical protein
MSKEQLEPTPHLANSFVDYVSQQIGDVAYSAPKKKAIPTAPEELLPMLPEVAARHAAGNLITAVIRHEAGWHSIEDVQDYAQYLEEEIASVQDPPEVMEPRHWAWVNEEKDKAAGTRKAA